MDPTATLTLLLDSIRRSEDVEVIEEHRDNLVNWLKSGGFPPDFNGLTMLDRALITNLLLMGANDVLRVMANRQLSELREGA
jgi:hypothetical protein